MSIVSLLILLIVCGVLLWAVNNYIPMDPKIKQLVNILVVIVLVIFVVIFLLRLVGIDTGARLNVY